MCVCIYIYRMEDVEIGMYFYFCYSLESMQSGSVKSCHMNTFICLELSINHIYSRKERIQENY